MSATPPLHTSLTPDALRASFDALRKNARYAADLRDWIEDHPEMFLGNAMLPENPDVTIGFTVAHFNVMNVAKNKGLLVEVSLSVKSPFSQNPLLPQLIGCSFSTPNINYQYKNMLKLSLTEWPFAAATVAGVFLENDKVTQQVRDVQVLQDYIDAALALHFPGFTLDMLRDWVEAGFIERTEQGNVRARDIQEVLYASMEKQAPTALPDVVSL